MMVRSCRILNRLVLRAAVMLETHTRTLAKVVTTQVESEPAVKVPRVSKSKPGTKSGKVSRPVVRTDEAALSGEEQHRAGEEGGDDDLALHHQLENVPHPDMQTTAARLKTFPQTWPDGWEKQNPMLWAEAGYLFIGTDEQPEIECFCCRTNLFELPKRDCWEEHADRSSECRFLHLVKSQEFLKPFTERDSKIRDLVECSQRLREDMREGRLNREELETREDALMQREESFLTELTKTAGESSFPDGVTAEQYKRYHEHLFFNSLVTLEHCQESDAVCSLRLALEFLNDRICTDSETDVTKKVINDTNKLMATFVKSLSDVLIESGEDTASCSANLKGSTTNNLNTGRIDELDFLITLDHETVREEDGWKLVKDNEMIKFSGDDARDLFVPVNFEGSWLLRRQTPESSEAGTSSKSSSFQYFSARRIEDTFSTAFNTAVVASATKQKPERESTPTFCRFVKPSDESTAVIWFPPEVHYGIKLDIHPCVQYIRSNGAVQELVPSTLFNNWRLVNCDPPELANPVVLQSIRVLKVLRDCCTDDCLMSNDLSTRLYHVIEKDRREFHDLPLITNMITNHFDWEIISPNTSKCVPSYAIMGTVMKCYRQNPEQLLCSLVVDSLRHFEFISPDGSPLCREQTPYPNLIVRLIEFSQVLNHINQGSSNLEDTVREVIPNYYLDSPSNLAERLIESPAYEVAAFTLSDLTPKITKKGKKVVIPQDELDMDKFDAGALLAESSEESFTVYRVEPEHLVSTMLQQLTLGEKRLREALEQLVSEEQKKKTKKNKKTKRTTMATKSTKKKAELYIAVTAVTNAVYTEQVNIQYEESFVASSLRKLLMVLKPEAQHLQRIKTVAL